jgi:hypothetical protein
MYIGAGVGAFLVAGYQLFKTRKTSTDNSDSIEVHTTLECTQCTKKTERLFERGDYVYKNISPCTDCSGQMVITKIIVPEDPVIGG